MEYHEGREFVVTYMKPENIIVLSVFLYSATCTCISTLYAMFLLVLCIVLFKYYLESFCPKDPIRTLSILSMLYRGLKPSIQKDIVQSKCRHKVECQEAPSHNLAPAYMYISTDFLHLKLHPPLSKERSKFLTYCAFLLTP